MTPLYVIKFNGEKEPFSPKKVYRAARRVGADKETAREIAKKIEKEVYPGIKTAEISQEVRKLLRREKPKAALRFNLKKAIKKLGPTGFPFEKYIGAVFSEMGFKVRLNQIIPGLCCEYEIDFTAQKGNLLYVVECKYRNLPRSKVESDISLANYARFLDIKNGNFFNQNSFRKFKTKSLLVTNNKFTSKAIKYSRCVGVELLGWSYPRSRGLEYLIDSSRLYPITILPSLNRELAEIFALKKIILIQDILKIGIKNLARRTKIPEKYLGRLAKEADILLRN